MIFPMIRGGPRLTNVHRPRNEARTFIGAAPRRVCIGKSPGIPGKHAKNDGYASPFFMGKLTIFDG